MTGGHAIIGLVSGTDTRVRGVGSAQVIRIHSGDLG